MTATAPVRPVWCGIHGGMAYDAATATYVCGLRGACLAIPAAELQPYFDLTDDVITLTPPGANG